VTGPTVVPVQVVVVEAVTGSGVQSARAVPAAAAARTVRLQPRNRRRKTDEREELNPDITNPQIHLPKVVYR
jgi:hypothetical protein